LIEPIRKASDARALAIGVNHLGFLATKLVVDRLDVIGAY
jgi:hypothetical protein